jgi:YVTN family beta-propeller protein
MKHNVNEGRNRKMKRKAVSGIFLTILLASAFTLVLWVQPPLTSASGIVKSASTLQAANTVKATITGLNAPEGVAVTPNGAYVYVTNDDSGTVSVISTATNTVTATVNVGSEPEGVAVSPSGAYVYVANGDSDAGNGSVSVISTATNTVTSIIPNAFNLLVDAEYLAVTPDGQYIYASNGNGLNTISVISTATNTAVAAIDPQVPGCLAVTPNGQYVYDADQGITGGGRITSGFVSVISTANNTIVARVTGFDPLGQPFGVAVTPDGNYVYVTNRGENSSVGGQNSEVPSQDVSVISTATNTVTANITVGDFPTGVAVSPNGQYVYVTNIGNN